MKIFWNGSENFIKFDYLNMDSVELKVKKINILFLYLLPPAVIFSNFLMNLIVAFIAISYLILFYKKIIKNDYWLFYFIIFYLYTLINPSNFNITNSNYFDFENIIKIIFFFRFPIFFLAVINWLLDDRNKLNLIINLLIVSIVFVSIDIVIQYIFKIDLLGNLPGQYNTELNRYSRYSGPFGDELIGGSYLYRNIVIIISILIIIINSREENTKEKIFLNSILFFTILACIFSGERIALLKLLTLVVLSIILIKNIKVKLIIFSSLIIFFLSSIFISDNLRERYYNQTIKEIGSLENIKSNSLHFKHYKLTTFFYKDNLIFGNGTRSFRYVCEEFRNKKNLSNELKELTLRGCSTHPHNFFLEILHDHGIVGLIMFLVFFLTFLKFLNKKTKLGLIYTIINFIPFLPSGAFYSSWDNVNYWFILSILFIIDREKFSWKLRL